MFRRTPVAAAEITFHSPHRTAVELRPAPGRWPANEALDRIELALGLCALAAGGASQSRWDALRELLAELAARLATERGDLPGDLVDLGPLGSPGHLTVVPWSGSGRASVLVELHRAAGGSVPRWTRRPPAAGPFAEVAALALLIGLAVDRPGDRLALALGVEGVLAWFRESDRRGPARSALAFAVAHADGRLREAGRPGLSAIA